MYEEANKNIEGALEATDRVMDIMTNEMSEPNPNYDKLITISQIGIISMLTALSSQLDILISITENE